MCFCDCGGVNGVGTNGCLSNGVEVLSHSKFAPFSVERKKCVVCVYASICRSSSFSVSVWCNIGKCVTRMKQPTSVSMCVCKCQSSLKSRYSV